MKKMTMIITVLLVAIFMFSSLYAEVGFSGDATVVSTYFWRGVKQFNGAALQGTAEFAHGPLAFGYWTSSMGETYAVETDPYISLALPTGQIESSVGATIYSYDFFAKEEYTVYEVFGSVGVGPISASYYFAPEQQDGDIESVYWLEVGCESAACGADLGATFGYGSYSAFMSPKEDAVASVLLSASKAVSEEVAVSWNWILGVNDGMDNGFYLSAAYGF
jgi:hypothetical protein